jgi:hypothetical protein
LGHDAGDDTYELLPAKWHLDAHTSRGHRGRVNRGQVVEYPPKRGIERDLKNHAYPLSTAAVDKSVEKLRIIWPKCPFRFESP